MKLPLGVSGHDLAHALREFGYQLSRQTGSHLRLTTEREGQHHLTIPNHKVLRVGAVAAILGEVATHFGLTCEQLLERLFGNVGQS